MEVVVSRLVQATEDAASERSSTGHRSFNEHGQRSDDEPECDYCCTTGLPASFQAVIPPSMCATFV